MAVKANRTRVDEGLVTLRDVLKPVCERNWSQRYGSRWLVAVNGNLNRPDDEPSTDDPAFLLKGIIATWEDVWKSSPRLGNRDKHLVYEVERVRDLVAHHKPFTVDDADRALGAIEQLLASFDATEDHREKVKQHRDSILLRRYKKLRQQQTPLRPPADETPSDQPSEGEPLDSVSFPHRPVDELVSLSLDQLKTGLELRCRRNWSKVYGREEWRATLNGRVSKPSDSKEGDDLAFLLQGIIATWDDVWAEKHGRQVRRWVSDIYSEFIDSDSDSDFDASWMLSTIVRVLGRFGATKQKKNVENYHDDLILRRYERLVDDDAGRMPSVEVSAPSELAASVVEGERDAVLLDPVDRPTDSATTPTEAPEGSPSRDLGSGVPAEDGDGGFGSLGAALLSAGFGTDGSLPDTKPESVVPAPKAEPEPAPAAQPPAPAKARKGVAARVQDEDAETAAVVPDPVEEEPVSPYDKPGAWYVIHAYSGHEKKVKANLATRTSSMHMQDRIFEVVIPTEKVVEIKGGRKVEVEKRMFPGYLLIRMYLDDDSWHAVRDTPGVTSFVGMGTGYKPTSLSKREVERFLGLKTEAAKKPPRFRPAWAIGETVRVSSGPFADFNGVVEDINVDQQKVTVLVEIFGRDTPMELAFEQIQKQ